MEIYLIILALIATAFYYGKISQDQKKGLKIIADQWKSIEEVFNLQERLNNYEKYLDLNDKQKIKNIISEIKIPSIYKKLETELKEKKIYNKIHTVSEFKINLDLYLESYNDKFYKCYECNRTRSL